MKKLAILLAVGAVALATSPDAFADGWSGRRQQHGRHEGRDSSRDHGRADHRRSNDHRRHAPVRDHLVRVGGGRHVHHHGCGHSGVSFNFGLGFGHHYRPHYHHPRYVYAPVYAYPAYASYPAPVAVVRPAYAVSPQFETGSIDTDIRPSSAAVYLDGVPIGIADDFDGWPAKLVVEPGDHTLTFVEPGFHSTSVSITVVPRHTSRIELDLSPLGPGADAGSFMPQELRASSTYESAPPPPARAPSPARRGGDLRLEVEPAGAAVYIDGEAYGTAGAGPFVIAGLPAGRYQVDVLLPNFEPFKGVVVILDDASAVELRVRLRPQGSSGSSSQLAPGNPFRNTSLQ